jgi:hypothetical protein
MIAQDENMLACFVNAEQPPIKVKHICYFTSPNIESDKINLNEVYEATYPHPEAPEDAVIMLTTTRLVKTMRRSAYDGAHILLMEAQQKACRYIEVR